MEAGDGHTSLNVPLKRSDYEVSYVVDEDGFTRMFATIRTGPYEGQVFPVVPNDEAGIPGDYLDLTEGRLEQMADF